MMARFGAIVVSVGSGGGLRRCWGELGDEEGKRARARLVFELELRSEM